MVLTATVQSGKITLPPDINVPDGTRVQIEFLDEQPQNLLEALKDFAGIGDDMPADLAINHDFYLNRKHAE